MSADLYFACLQLAALTGLEADYVTDIISGADTATSGAAQALAEATKDDLEVWTNPAMIRRRREAALRLAPMTF